MDLFKIGHTLRRIAVNRLREWRLNSAKLAGYSLPILTLAIVGLT